MASCISCKKDAQYYCGKCMRVKYCGSSCQKSHFKQHNSFLKSCVPFYFIAGKKRTSAEEKEDEDKAESDYVKLYAAYKRSGDETLIPQLENLFGRMSEAARTKYRDGLPCHEGVDPLSQDSIASLEPDNRFYLMTNNIKYCFNLDLLVGYVNSREAIDPVYGVQGAINPISRQPLSEEDIQRLRDAKETRKPTLWEKIRETQDVVVLQETLDILLNMYREKEYIIQGAKSDRLKRELKKIDLTKLCSIIENWSLLNVLGLTLETIPWNDIKDPSGCFEGFKKLFKTTDDLKTTFWDVSSFQTFLKKFDVVSQFLHQSFFPDAYKQTWQNLKYFKNLKLSLSRYFLKINNDNPIEIFPIGNQTIRQAYNRVFNEADIEDIPDDRELVNETWLAFNSFWGADDDQTPETVTEYELPWPGKPVFGEDGVATLIVVTEYDPPGLEIEFNFPRRLKGLQPRPLVDLSGQDLLKPAQQFTQYLNVWPKEWDFVETKNYKIRLEIIIADFTVDTEFVDSIVAPPAKEIYDLLRNYIYDGDRAGPSIGEDIVWKVIVSIVPNLDDVYAKGIKHLAENWKHYRNDVGVDYGDIDWKKLPYDPKDGKYWAQLFDGVEDLERASSVNVFFDFRNDVKWDMRKKENNVFWTVVLGVKKIDGKVIDKFVLDFSEAESARLQKEWAKTAKYQLAFPDTAWAHRDVKIRKSMDLYSSYQRALSYHLHMLHELGYGRVAERWISIQTWWAKLPNIIAENKGTFELPWPKQMPKLEGPNDEVVLNVRVKRDAPYITIRPKVSEKLQALGFTTSLNYQNISDLLDNISKYQGNREFQNEVKTESVSWWNFLYRWDRWPADENRFDYQIHVVFSKEERITSKITNISKMTFDNISNSPYVSIIQNLSNLIEDGLLDNARDIYIEIYIEEKQK